MLTCVGEGAWLESGQVHEDDVRGFAQIIQVKARISRSRWPRHITRGLLGMRFESRRGHECPSLGNAVCSQVEAPATGRTLVQRNPTECVHVHV